MTDSLRILHLGDEPHDGEFLEKSLAQARIDCSIKRTVSQADFSRALDAETFHLVIATRSTRGFNGISVLDFVQARNPRLPVILTAETVDEEEAATLLDKGASDYVPGNCAFRVAQAVRRVIQGREWQNEREDLEKRLVQAQKMELLGQLTSGVAHDFNNVLGIIMGNNDYIVGCISPDDPLLKNGEEIRHAAKRAAALTQQLLCFSRNQGLLTTVVDLNEVVSSMDKMLYRLVGENITLGIALEKKLGSIKINSGQVSQVLMNLVINARDAMPNGGRLTINTRNARIAKQKTIEGREIAAGDYVVLTVADTGTGMTEEVKARLFEPFYTTKPAGKGTGLGLATCANILKQAQGFMRVESVAGQGTTFHVHFPRVDEPAEVAASLTKTGALSGGTETLLVVEDESGLRRVVTMALQGQGYTVLQASNGQDGLRVAREHKGRPIDLVITDVVMPQMGGDAMVEWLKSMHPNLKTLFTSGYNDQAVARQGKGYTNFLAKPYTLSVLTRKVREILDAP
jgi:signal transduction histidine kinase